MISLLLRTHARLLYSPLAMVEYLKTWCNFFLFGMLFFNILCCGRLLKFFSLLDLIFIYLDRIIMTIPKVRDLNKE
jgi:hypothetical protein